MKPIPLNLRPNTVKKISILESPIISSPSSFFPRTIFNHANKEIDHNEVMRLVDTLKGGHSQITSIDLTNANVNDEYADALSWGLENNNSVQILNLSHNQIGESGASFLGNALKTNHSIQDINLSFNRIGYWEAFNLADGLKVNKSVQQIDFTGNDIGDEGTKVLAKAIIQNARENGRYIQVIGIQNWDKYLDAARIELESAVQPTASR